MKRGFAFTFFFGLLIGGMAALIVWYYQKSTSAEDGALVLLDRLAEADRRLRQLMSERLGHGRGPTSPRIQVTTAPTDEMPSFLQRTSTAVAEDLTQVKGIGPVFANKLTEAGIHTVAGLITLTPVQLAAILEISDGRAENIIAAAQAMSR